MKRNRSKSILVSEEDEYSLRERRSMKHTGKSDDANKQVNNNEEEDEEDQQHKREPGPSDQNTSTRMLQAIRFLSVTCGNKKAILDTDKLRQGVDCIECEGHWFAPSDFEYFAGKGACKKWKNSVLHDNKPLKLLFEKGLITTKGYKRRANDPLKPQKILSSYINTNSFSEDSDKQSAEEMEKDKGKDYVQSPGSENFNLKMEEQEEEIEAPKNGGEGHAVDSGYDKSNDEEEETEHGEMEDDEMSPPAAADDDDDGRNPHRKETKKILPSIKLAFQQRMEALFERILEGGLQSNCMELIDSWSKSLHEAQTEAIKENRGLEMVDASITTAQDNSQISDVPPSVEDLCRNEGQVMQIHKEADRQQTGVKAERENSPGCPSATPTSPGHFTSGDTELFNVIKLEMSVPETTQASVNQYSSYTVEPPLPVAVVRPNLETMDLNHMKREKMKMQLKVLKLQEEYYTLILNDLKSSNSFARNCSCRL